MFLKISQILQENTCVRVSLCNSLKEFKILVKLWNLEVCSCRMCKTYILRYVSFDPTEIWKLFALKISLFLIILVLCIAKKTEYLQTTLIITISLLMFLSKSTIIWEYIGVQWKDSLGCIWFCVAIKCLFSWFSLYLYCIFVCVLVSTF